jgi:methionyl-tRNA formyltransferase
VTGVTIMQVELGLDSGPMLLKREVPIGHKNAAQLTDELAQIGAELMVEYLAEPGRYPPEAQNEDEVTYAAKIRKEEARIDWAFPALQILHQVRGLAPFPGAWFEHDGERIKLLDAEVVEADGQPGEILDENLLIASGENALQPLLVQRAGKGAMSADELLRGSAIPKGTTLP